MKITVDITGMYYRTTVEVDAGASVFDVMTKATQKLSDDGKGLMSFTTSPSKTRENPDGTPMQFVNCIKIVYSDRPVSRQGNGPRVKGTYLFNDDLPTTSSQPGSDILFQLAWQYYITDRFKKIKNLGEDGSREIFGLENSNIPPKNIDFEEGDVITWRLVAIFGLVQTAEEEIAKRNLKGMVPMGSARYLGDMLKALPAE